MGSWQQAGEVVVKRRKKVGMTITVIEVINKASCGLPL